VVHRDGVRDGVVGEHQRCRSTSGATSITSCAARSRRRTSARALQRPRCPGWPSAKRRRNTSWPRRPGRAPLASGWPPPADDVSRPARVHDTFAGPHPAVGPARRGDPCSATGASHPGDDLRPPRGRYSMISLKRNRSRCASGSVRHCSPLTFLDACPIGFWCQHRNGSGIGKGLAADRRCRSPSPRASRTALAARLISSASTKLAPPAELDSNSSRPCRESGYRGCRTAPGPGELQPGERAADHFATVSHGQRLGNPRHTFEQQVRLGQAANQHPLDQPVLSDDHPLDLEHRALEQLALAGRAGRTVVGRRTADRAAGWPRVDRARAPG